MFAPDSPLLNIPVALEKRQAIFLDGLRHHAQIAIYAYIRLCHALSELSDTHISEEKNHCEFTHIFLDTWAFIESIDRFRQLWRMQPFSETIPEEFSPSNLNKKLQPIRDIRNVSAHIAQKIDQISSINSSISGQIRWIKIHNKDPIAVKTYFIRPGILHGNLSTQFATFTGKILLTHDVGSILLNAGTHEGNLSDAYSLLCSIVKYTENHLAAKFIGASFKIRLPTDIMGSAELHPR